MTPYISLPVRHGKIVPNLWVMILAGTTITRKSTSLNIATEVLDDITDDWMLATDGSPEGLMTELGFRDGKTSVFLRDEITGFMSSMTGRDYMSGMLEGFCQLYDGVPQVRQLRRERIEIKKPFFIFMGGGIKSRMEEVVTMEHIRSGFIPRFIFVTGSTSRDQIRPIGPPEDNGDGDESPREQIINELWRINEHYTRSDDAGTPVLKIAGITKVAAPKEKRIQLKGTPEFWDRLRQLDDDAISMGEKSSAHELYTPLYVRLGNSVLKVAMLLAGAEFRDTVTLADLQKAIYLSQEWVEAVTEFAANVEQQPEMDKWERKCDKIINWVRASHPAPLTQTAIMQKYRIRKRDIPDIEATLIARGAISIYPYPHKQDMKGGEIYYRISETAQKSKPSPAMKRIQREDSYRVTNDQEEGYEEDPPYPQTNGKRIRFPAPRQ